MPSGTDLLMSVTVTFGAEVKVNVEPGAFSYLEISLSNHSDVSMQFSGLASDTGAAVYVKYGGKPSHVDYDTVQKLTIEG